MSITISAKVVLSTSIEEKPYDKNKTIMKQLHYWESTITTRHSIGQPLKAYGNNT